MTVELLESLFLEMNQNLAEDQVDSDILVKFINILRPDNPNHIDEIKAKFKSLIDYLTEHHTDLLKLQQYLLRLLNQYKQVSLYTESGILSSEGFTTQLTHRIGAHFLPLLEDKSTLKYLVGQVFYTKSDMEWLENIPDSEFRALLNLLIGTLDVEYDDYPTQLGKINYQLLKAINILSYRISSIGLHPELHYIYPELSEVTSPFIMQNRELVAFTNHVVKSENLELSLQYPILSQNLDDDIAFKKQAALHLEQAQVMLDQCRAIMLKVRRSTRRLGVSLSLTYLLTVLEQILQRIEYLLLVVADNDIKDNEKTSAIKMLLIDFVQSNYNDKSVAALLQTNTELIALQVTENASRTGEHYVSTNKKGYFAMYRSAAGAGAIIAVMATIKVLTPQDLAPFMQAVAYSLNYGLGFVLIHILHCTVATKQPAMTAAALAATIQNSTGSKNARLAELAALIINIWRTQFIAIVGNISITMPIAFIICVFWSDIFSSSLVSYAKATHLLEGMNPFSSLALLYAAIAGVCLFLSGLITGYYDNLAVYRKIGARINAHPILKQHISTQKLQKIAHYIENNLGAIVGNFTFGIMLGSMATIGFILGLPLDIRHIAFSSANLIQGLFHLPFGAIDIGLVLVSFLGVLLIGMVNLIVSFSLTIVVALRARRVKVQQWSPLLKLILTHFVMHPSDFFWPPKQPLKIEEQHKS